MPKVVKEDVDSLNSQLTITIEKSDYEPKFLQELKKYKNQAHLKGFRKGRTPMSAVRKMFGKGILSEIVNDLFQKTLYDYIKDEKLDVLGQPLLKEGQQPLEFDTKFLNDFQLQFELGLAPDIDIMGLGKTITLPKYKIVVPDEIIEEDLENARLRLGDFSHPEEDIQEEDALELEVVELDESGSPKENGLESQFTVLVNDLSEEYKTTILSKKKGEVLKVNLLELESAFADMEEDIRKQRVQSFYLQLDKDADIDFNPEFEATILDVRRRKKADLDNEFFTKFFGPDTEIEDEEGAKEQIKKDYEEMYDKQADSLLYKETLDKLQQLNEFPLPDDFLKNWLKQTDENISHKKLEEEYEKFAEQTRRSVLITKLRDQYELEASQEEIKEKAIESISEYGAYYLGGNESLIAQVAERSLSDPKQVNRYYEDVMREKLWEKLKEEINTEEKAISIDDFQDLMKNVQEAIEAGEPKFYDEEE